MLTVIAQRIAKTDQTIDIQVFITASAGSPGIESVNVTGITLSNLATETPPGCPAHFSFVVRAIPLTDIPVYIEGRECPVGVDQGQAVGVRTSVGPVFGEEIGMVECNPQGGNQNNRACIELQNEIQLLRNTILNECGQSTNLKNQADVAFWTASGASAIALGLVAAAVAAGWPWGILLGILAAIAAIVAAAFWVQYYALRKKVDLLLEHIGRERGYLATLIARLFDVCCPEFIKVMTDVPLCP